MPSSSDGLLEKLTNLLPFTDYSSHDQYQMEIGRANLILLDILELPTLTNRPDFLDIEALFKEHLELDPITFCELSFGSSSKFLRIRLEELEANPKLGVLRRSFFSKSKMRRRKSHTVL